MSEALSQAQPFIQLEEVMKGSSNPSTKPSKDETKLKSVCKAPDYVPADIRSNLLTRSRCSP